MGVHDMTFCLVFALAEPGGYNKILSGELSYKCVGDTRLPHLPYLHHYLQLRVQSKWPEAVVEQLVLSGLLKFGLNTS